MNGFLLHRLLILAAGAAIDLAAGDPQGFPHPVRAIGKLITATERFLRRIMDIPEAADAGRGRKRLAGAVLTVFVAAVSTAVPFAVIRAARLIHPYLAAAAEIAAVWQILAMRSLRDAAMDVYRPLAAGNTEAARRAVSMIVGRDTDRLDSGGIARAAVETVAENFTDGVVSPLIFMIIFGVPGGFFCKAVNTMDSMIGYRNDRYRDFGTAAAKLDDTVNYIPARAAALFMILAAFLLPGCDGRGAARIFRRDRYRHPSPNSAQTESACAGALGIRLAGDMWYFGELHRKPWIGDAGRPAEPEDIRRAVRLMAAASALAFAAGLAVLAAAAALIR